MRPQTIQKLHTKLSQLVLTLSYSKKPVTQGEKKPTKIKKTQKPYNPQISSRPASLHIKKCPMPCPESPINNRVRIFQDISGEHKANRKSRCIPQLLAASV